MRPFPGNQGIGLLQQFNTAGPPDTNALPTPPPGFDPENLNEPEPQVQNPYAPPNLIFGVPNQQPAPTGTPINPPMMTGGNPYNDPPDWSLNSPSQPGWFHNAFNNTIGGIGNVLHTGLNALGNLFTQDWRHNAMSQPQLSAAALADRGFGPEFGGFQGASNPYGNTRGAFGLGTPNSVFTAAPGWAQLSSQNVRQRNAA